MSERGVFAVDRGVFGHEMFDDEPFTQREAFIWLLSEAAFKDRRKRIGPHVYDLKRGQIAHSIRFMASQWKWSKSRVERFLNRLDVEGAILKSIGTVAGQSLNIITLCNYNKYQILSLPKVDDVGTVAGQSRDKLEDTKNTKEDLASKEAKYMIEAEFNDIFWPAYPHKIAKVTALRAFEKARQKAELETIIMGLERYKRSKPPSISWSHPATWLNKERWEDQPAVDDVKPDRQSRWQAAIQETRGDLL